MVSIDDKLNLIRSVFCDMPSDKKIRLQKGYINNTAIFFPANQESLDIHKQMTIGQEIDCKYSFPRNPGNHRRFFAFLNLAFESQEFYDNIHHFRKWLIGAAGHYTIIKTPKGKVIFDADSIAWDSMDEVEFREVFNDCVNAFINTFGEKIPKEKIDEIIRF